jgi:hypothetical protein
MQIRSSRSVVALAALLALAHSPAGTAASGPASGRQPGGSAAASIGRERAVARHLGDGEEFSLPLRALLAHGRLLFSANWTRQEGGGRPHSKGTGGPLSNPSAPLLFPRNFNRISAPDANSCAGCHNAPMIGGGGDIVANVFVLGQRFDFATLDRVDPTPTASSFDENGDAVGLQTVANSRNTLGMGGSGYIEILAREMSADLRRQRDATQPGACRELSTKGVAFGTLCRRGDGSWDASGVEGLPAPSLAGTPPSLLIRPFHQAGAVVSLRQFSNNAFNHHHGIQPTERFGAGTDADGDGFADELTRADVTAVSVFQATLPVPGRVIPDDRAVEQAVLLGEARFASIGCAHCHRPALTLMSGAYTEPNPFNPPGNLQPGQAPELRVDLAAAELPAPRLPVRPDGSVVVPAYTDLKLHDITSGQGDPDCEPLDMQAPAGSPAFFAGNCRFLTRKLWGSANEPPYYHHGLYGTIREAVLAHAGEALAPRQAFESLPAAEQDALIEFLKTLQMLPPGTRHLVVNEHGRPKRWPPRDLGHRSPGVDLDQ